MLKTRIALPLTLLLSVSPVLSAVLPLICCCDDGTPGFHLRYEEHASSGHNHGDDHAHPQVSHYSDDKAENHHDAHQDHNSDADDKNGVDLAARAGSIGLLSAPCTCSAADHPTGKAVSIAKAGITKRATCKPAFGHLDSVVEVALEGLYLDNLTISAGDLSPPGPHVFLVNRTLLI